MLHQITLSNGRILQVKTEYWRKPIPTKQFDWSAWVDGYEEKGSAFGPTEDMAISDLIMTWEGMQ